jgi:transcriptional regulator of acetoin/glycerol metabolism
MISNNSQYQDDPQPEEQEGLAEDAPQDITPPLITLEVETYNRNEAIKALIVKAINDNQNKGVYEIAKMLGMGKSSLYRYIYKYQITMPNRLKYQSNT